MSTRLFQEDNQSATVEFDLAEYLPLFVSANTGSISRESQEYKEFQKDHAALFEYFDGMGGLNLMADMEDACLERYSQEEKDKIINSPAYTLLHDSFRELLKNAVDVFLEHHLKNPDNTSSKIKFNFHIQASEDEISLTFSDSGSGFPREILKNLKNEEKQLKYIHTHHYSKKRIEGTVGLLGGGAFGLRQLIHQVLTGKELRPGRKIPRSTLFDSEILFSNRTNAYCHGGSIAITTSLAPIPDLDIEASTEIEKYRDSKIAYSPSSDTTSSEDSSHSNSSRATVADSLSSSDIDHKPSLDLDIDDPFIDRSSVPKKDKLHPSIGLALDIPSRDADEMFAGNSPMLPKQTKKFDALSPVVDKKQHTAHNATKSKQVVDTSAVPNKHSEKVGRRASRARDSAQSGNSSSDINTTLRALQKSYKLKFADTRAQNEASQKPKSGEEYQRLKKTS